MYNKIEKIILDGDVIETRKEMLSWVKVLEGMKKIDEEKIRKYRFDFMSLMTMIRHELKDYELYLELKDIFKVLFKFKKATDESEGGIYEDGATDDSEFENAEALEAKEFDRALRALLKKLRTQPKKAMRNITWMIRGLNNKEISNPKQKERFEKLLEKVYALTLLIMRKLTVEKIARKKEIHQDLHQFFGEAAKKEITKLEQREKYLTQLIKDSKPELIKSLEQLPLQEHQRVIVKEIDDIEKEIKKEKVATRAPEIEKTRAPQMSSYEPAPRMTPGFER